MFVVLHENNNMFKLWIYYKVHVYDMSEHLSDDKTDNFGVMDSRNPARLMMFWCWGS